MRDRRRTTAALLAGGVALAGAGFAIGSQADDGSAVAARGASGPEAGFRTAHFGGGPGGPGFRHHGPGPDLSSLADDLGVSEEQLREAFEALRDDMDPEDELAAFLAQALGVERAKVDEALEGLRTQHEQEHEQRHDEFAQALADELGISADKVREAFDALRPDAPGDRRRFRDRGPRPMLGALARELGVTRAELRKALVAVRPDVQPAPRPGPGGPPGHHGPGDLAADLAEALGVEEGDVEQALEDFHESRRDAFAQKLADELGIDVEKVQEALPDHP